MRKQDEPILSFTCFSYFNFLIEMEKNYLSFKLPSLSGKGLGDYFMGCCASNLLAPTLTVYGMMALSSNQTYYSIHQKGS